MKTEVITYHLEMLSPSGLRGVNSPSAEFEVKQAAIPCPELNHFLYTSVGGDWYWIDRLVWNYLQWFEYLNRPELETWVAYLSGTVTGYFELEKQEEGNIEIAYFGLLAPFIGKKLGGALLTAAVKRAWQMGAARVWVHTCTLDGPFALRNYQARGFRLFKEERAWKDLPDLPLGPWPGSRNL